MSKGEYLQTLLKNLVDSQQEIEIAFLYSNQGLLISKYVRDKEPSSNTDDSDDVYGAITTLVDGLLNKISLEYKIGHYGTGSFETSEHRIVYVETGSEAILMLVCNYNINLNNLFPIAYLVAEKITQLLEDSFDFRYNTLDVPNLNIDYSFNIGLENFEIKPPKTVINGVYANHQIKRNENIKKMFKLIVLGDAAVGKTTLVNRFLRKEQMTDYRPTLGINIATQNYRIQGYKDDTIQFLIFDLAGQEFFKRVRHEYYIGANCAFIVYDVTRRDTFKEATNFWFNDARKEMGNIPIVLVGNKIDLAEQREVSTEEGVAEASKLGCSFIDTSALENINVQDTFKIVGIGLFFQSLEDLEDDEEI
ncbi:MAG: GTP-binding protein [Promethearchaeota archaeon]